jgi:hypothetical protein
MFQFCSPAISNYCPLKNISTFVDEWIKSVKSYVRPSRIRLIKKYFMSSRVANDLEEEGT